MSTPFRQPATQAGSRLSPPGGREVIPILAGSVLDPLYGAFGSVLAGYFSVVKSYGVAIALLTISLRIVLIPLTAKQVRSQQAMSKLQPEMKRLQAKHKGDRQKLNEEMMALYKEHGANPLSGCLPILLQMPLFIVLYRLILDLSHKVDGVARPKHLPDGSLMQDSLIESGGRMMSWGIDLAEKAGSVKGGLGDTLPFYLLVGLVVATGYYQQRQMSARTPKDAVNPQMQMVMKIFPVMFGVISLSVPAGVVVYFIVSNIWQIGQQAITFRTNPPAHVAAEREAKANGEPPPKETKGVGSKGGSKEGGSPKALPKGGASKKATGAGSRRPANGSAGSSARAPRPSGRAQPKKNRPNTGGDSARRGGRPAPSPRPKGLPAPGAGSSNGQAEQAPRNPFRRGRKGT